MPRKAIDPALREYLDGLVPPPGTNLPSGDAERVALGRGLMLNARYSRESIPGLPNAVEMQNLTIDGRISARLYDPPDRSGSAPLLVYFHGGGWVVGSIETHDPFCRLLSAAAGIMILAIDYRLAPEQPFPAGLDDAFAAISWAREEGRRWGANSDWVAIGGDSAGANLAAVVSNSLSQEGPPHWFRGQMLLFPVTDHPVAAHPSYAENGTGYGLDASLMRWFWQLYAPAVPPGDPDISPLRRPNLPDLPPTLVVTAEYDPLRDEGIAYATKLRLEGVELTHMHWPDMHHNFAVHPGTVARFPQAKVALARIAGWLRASLTTVGT